MDECTASKNEMACQVPDTSKKLMYILINESNCMESTPCTHSVSFDGGETWVYMSGLSIYDYCKQSGQTIPDHFNGYRPGPERVAKYGR